MTDENLRFKNQFSEKQWSKLMADNYFKAAWDSNDFIKAGEIASTIIYGNEPNITEARQQTNLHRAIGDLLE
jgi:hypothetical protein